MISNTFAKIDVSTHFGFMYITYILSHYESKREPFVISLQNYYCTLYFNYSAYYVHTTQNYTSYYTKLHIILHKTTHHTTQNYISYYVPKSTDHVMLNYKYRQNYCMCKSICISRRKCLEGQRGDTITG